MRAGLMVALVMASLTGCGPWTASAPKTNAEKCVLIGGVYETASRHCVLPAEPAAK